MFSPRRFLHYSPLWGLALLAVLLWAGVTLIRYQTWLVPAQRMQASSSGQIESLASNAPSLPAVYLDGDSAYWLRYATDILEGRTLRPRHTDWDNTPDGRDIHWSSLLPWLMAGSAQTASLFSEHTATELLPAVSIWINPILFLLFLCVTAWLLSRQFKPWTAGLLTLTLFCLLPLRKDFWITRIDHHGLVDLPSIWMSLLLLVGMVRCHASRIPERVWFLAAGLVGGIGLWLQASIQLIPIAGILLALLLLSLFSKSAPDAPLLKPALWRTWARAGALTSLAFYALEYAPHHIGMRLEVNHPLYALAWWGAMEAILALAQRRQEQRWTPARFLQLLAGFLPGLAVAGLLVFGPARWFLLSSPLLQRIHAQIGEFTPLLVMFQGWDRLSLFYLFSFLPLIACGGIWMLFQKSTPPAARTRLGITLVPVLLALLLCLRHVRYASLLAGALWLATVAVLCPCSVSSTHPSRRRLALILLAVGCAVGLAEQVKRLPRPGAPPNSDPKWASQLIYRDIARELSTLPGFSGSRAVTGFTEAPSLQAGAGIYSTGGLYWENNEGLQLATLFFSSADEKEALQLLKDHGITWIVMNGSPQSVASWYFNRYGNISETGVRNSMAFRLATRAGVPDELERIQPHTIPLTSQASYLVYRVNTPTAP